jgi:hypothetical protein
VDSHCACRTQCLLVPGTTAEPMKNPSIRWGSDELAMREEMKKRDRWTSSMSVELVMLRALFMVVEQSEVKVIVKTEYRLSGTRRGLRRGTSKPTVWGRSPARRFRRVRARHSNSTLRSGSVVTARGRVCDIRRLG